MNEKRKVYIAIDLFKFIFAIIVIAIHTHPFESVENELFYKGFDLLSSIAVPFFFMTSGFLMSNKLNNIGYLKRILIRYLVLYIIWNIIYFPITIYGFCVSNMPLEKIIFSYLKGLFLVGEQYYSWPLWYLLGMVYILACSIVLKKNKKSLEKICLFNIIIYLIGILISVLIDMNSLLPIGIKKFTDVYCLIFENTRIMLGFGYFTIGILLRKNNTPISKKISFLGFIVSFVIGFINLEIFKYVSILLCALFITEFVVKINIKNDRSIFLRKLSTTIYLTHMIFFFLYNILILKVKEHFGLDSFLVTTIVSVVVGIILIKLFSKKKWYSIVFS